MISDFIHRPPPDERADKASRNGDGAGRHACSLPFDRPHIDAQLVTHNHRDHLDLQVDLLARARAGREDAREPGAVLWWIQWRFVVFPHRPGP